MVKSFRLTRGRNATARAGFRPWRLRQDAAQAGRCEVTVGRRPEMTGEVVKAMGHGRVAR